MATVGPPYDSLWNSDAQPPLFSSHLANVWHARMDSVSERDAA